MSAASFKVVLNSIVLIFPTELSLYLALIKNWEIQKLSFLLMSKAADSSASAILPWVSSTRGLRKLTSRAQVHHSGQERGHHRSGCRKDFLGGGRWCGRHMFPSDEFAGTHMP